MIPKIFITEWTRHAPWSELHQVEQDLIITTALIKIYSNPSLKECFAFRGGTALNKLIFKEPSRYSEDIDLVQITPQPIGSTINAIRQVMDPWLGKPKRDASEGLVTLTYRTLGEDELPIKLKIEINTREHFSILGFKEYAFSSTSTWHPGEAMISTYTPEELLGTKLRALYQRRKGRDLYDLYVALTTLSDLNTDALLHCFTRYTNQKISKISFLENMEAKLLNKEFRGDIIPLLSHKAPSFDTDSAYELVRQMLLAKL